MYYGLNYTRVSIKNDSKYNYKNYSKIEKIKEQNRVLLKEILEGSGMTDAGYRKAVANKTMTVEVLEKIATVLKVSPAVFFDDHMYYVKPDETKPEKQLDYSTMGKIVEYNMELSKENKLLITENAELRARLSLYEKREPIKNSVQAG